MFEADSDLERESEARRPDLEECAVDAPSRLTITLNASVALASLSLALFVLFHHVLVAPVSC